MEKTSPVGHAPNIDLEYDTLLDMKQAVLGATGNIGSLLVNELLDRDISVKALSRTIPEADERAEGVEYSAVDAEDAAGLIEATKDIDVLYATLAIPYGTETWQRSWPIVMQNVIGAAKANAFKIVFLDNVYMYGKVDGPMTEDTPINPIAKKGEVRAEVANMLLQAMESGEVTATIGRSADFYGPDTRMSNRFFEGTYNEGVATWMGSTDVLRTLSYTLDNAKALAILGNDKLADQKVWHMPAAPAMKGVGFAALAGKILGKDLETVLVPGNDPEARKAFEASMPEIAEMMYQYENDYVFDSTRFQETFGMQPTPYEVGFRHVYDTLADRAQP
jgi:nucleoside-diphosphate-sugar epimerase